MIRFLSAAVALILNFQIYLSAQFYITGENPASVKWNSLRTTNFEIIFPEKLGSDAVRLAGALEFALDSIGELQHPLRKRFPVIMQNGSMSSNGFVTLAPFRMELQITPSQDLYAQDWITQLALHEFRHVAQLNKLNQGATRVLGWITGDIARGVISSRFPSWFYEGDAVYNETRLSGSGRGRSAGFEMPLRALLMEKEKVYSYDKMMFGSYRDFVPDAYIYGYKMTEHLRNMGGPDVWSDALNRVARHPYQILPLAFFLKQNFGFFKQGLYIETIDSLKILYNNNEEGNTYSRDSINSEDDHKLYTNDMYPLEWKKSVISYRKGIDNPGSFIISDSSGREDILFYTGVIFSGSPDLYRSSLVWDEIKTDPRWQKRSYSVLRTCNLETGKVRTLTRRTRYFSPDYSPDGNHIAVIEIDNENRHFLTILDAFTGKIESKFASDDILLQPEWSGPDEIVLITVGSRGKQIESINMRSGEFRVLLPYTFNNLSDPVAWSSYILFRADQNNKESILALDTGNHSVYQVVAPEFGAATPSLSSDHKKLLFSSYSSTGFKIDSTTINPLAWRKIEFDIRGKTENFNQSSPAGLIDMQPYNKLAHLLRFHSWLPFYADIDQVEPFNTKIFPGFILFSQNNLGTAISSIGYSYQKGFHYLHPVFEWRGWYPVIRFSADFGGPRYALSSPEGLTPDGNELPPLRFSINTYLPLSFSKGPYFQYLRPEAEYEFIPVWHYFSDEVKRGISLYHFRFSAANYKRMALRDLYPRIGQSLSSTLSFQPSESIYGVLYSINSHLFFPGFLKHHHLFFVAGYQEQLRSRFFLPYNRVNYTRGYSDLIADRFFGISANYSFPVAYPDWAAGPAFYIKRVKANLFYDQGYGNNLRSTDEGMENINYNPASAGTEITADFHILRLIFPLSAGIRLGYKMHDNTLFTEFQVNINTNL